jgi:hypothetical protein
MEVSALTGKNIPEIFQLLTNSMIKNEKNNDFSKSKIKGKIDKSHVSSNYNNIMLDKTERLNENKQKNKCC